MASSEQTTKRHLNKPQPEDFVNVINDICDNMDNLDDAVPDSRKVNGHALNADVTVSKSDVGLGNVDNVQQVPATRKVNNKPLSSDINLQGTDIQVSSSDSRKVDAAIANCDNETASLKSAIDLQYQLKNIAGAPPWVLGYYLTTSVSTVDISSPTESSGMMYLVYPCEAGDKFRIKGHGGNNGRLWAFTDVSYNVIKRSEQGIIANNLDIIAPANAKYLIVNSEKSNDFTSSNVKIYVEKSTTVSNLNSNILSMYDAEKITGAPPWVTNYYIDTTGTTADVTQKISNSNMMCLVQECSDGDMYIVSANGNNITTRWAIIDDNGNIIQNTDGYSIANDLVVAPSESKYLVVNTYKSYSDRGVWKYVSKDGKRLSALEETVAENSLDIGALENTVETDKAILNTQYNKTKMPNWISGYYLDTSGTSVDYSTPVQNASMNYIVVNCAEGDIFCISGKGYTSARLWAFANSNNDIISASESNLTEQDCNICAPKNSVKLIVNSDVSYSTKGVYRAELKDGNTSDYSFYEQFSAEMIEGAPPWINGHYINTSGLTADESSPSESSGMNCLVSECVSGEKYKITGQGGNAARLWAFIDNNGNIITQEEASVYRTNLIVTAPTNASKLIVNVSKNYTYGVWKYTFSAIAKPHTRFLVLGNSYSADWCSYVPFILKELGITCEIYHYKRDRLTLRDLYYRWDSDSATDTETDEPAGTYNRAVYYIDTRTMNAWREITRVSAKSLVELGNYDFITMQQSVHHATDAESFSPWLMLDIGLINDSVDKNTPIAFVGVVTKPGDDNPQNNLSVLQNTIMRHYPFSFAIPYGTAVFNARTNTELADIGDSDYKNFWCDDNIHLQDGLPRYTAALAASQAIINKVFPQKSVLFNKIRVTTDLVNSWNAIQKHLPVVGITENNCFLVQQAAVMANNYPYEITTISDLPDAP